MSVVELVADTDGTVSVAAVGCLRLCCFGVWFLRVLHCVGCICGCLLFEKSKSGDGYLLFRYINHACWLPPLKLKKLPEPGYFLYMRYMPYGTGGSLEYGSMKDFKHNMKPPNERSVTSPLVLNDGPSFGSLSVLGEKKYQRNANDLRSQHSQQLPVCS